jgi:hypothetical protein
MEQLHQPTDLDVGDGCESERAGVAQMERVEHRLRGDERGERGERQRDARGFEQVRVRGCARGWLGSGL